MHMLKKTMTHFYLTDSIYCQMIKPYVTLDIEARNAKVL